MSGYYLFPPTGVNVDMADSPNVTYTSECNTLEIANQHIQRISVFPNPVSRLLTFESPDPGEHSVKIFSLDGQMVHSREMEVVSNQVDLSSLRNGVYFITIRSANFTVTEKIIKMN